MEMEDDCIIIEDSDEEAEKGKDRKEVFVISDSEETNNVPTLESREPLDQENAVLENPMYCEDDLTKREESEELEKDVLLQRLKKKLLQAKSLKEQQSLENLIQKRREKILKEKNVPPICQSSSKPSSDERNGFHMPYPSSPGVSFSIKNGTAESESKGQQQGGAFWSLQGERDVRDLFEGGKRFSDKDEKELKESLQSMQSDLEEKSARRRRREDGKGGNSRSQTSAVSNLSQFMQQQQQFQAEFKQHFGTAGSQHHQIHRNPRLQPYDKKSLEETQRQAGMAERLGPTNKGFNMLKAMGYKEGEGLGKEGEGRREPVTISKQQGKAGLGS